MSFDCTPFEVIAEIDVDDAPCAVCGSTEISDDWTFHWATPFSATVVAETCSPACTATVAATRQPDGVLPPFKNKS